MPTTVQVTKYTCNVCGYAYENYNTAVMCEAAAVIPEHEVHQVGQDITFDAEDSLSTVRTMSSLETGPVLAKVYLTIKNESGFFEHHVGYIVKCRVDEDEWEERMVVWSDDAAGGKKLYSPSEFRYMKDFHLNLPKNLKIIDHINQH